MKKTDIQKLRALNPPELEQKTRQLEYEIAKTKLAIKAGKEKNLKKANHLRHELAVIKTLLNQPTK